MDELTRLEKAIQSIKGDGKFDIKFSLFSDEVESSKEVEEELATAIELINQKYTLPHADA